MDINGTQVSQCPIEKIKEIIRSSPEYVVCTVKPVTHYTSHDDSPQQVRQPYTEVDPDLLRESTSDNASQYMAVKIGSAVSQSVEELQSLSNPEPSPSVNAAKSAHENYMNSEMFEFEQHNKLGKKLTNYAQLEFSTHT